jgi:hypothetical protein
MITLAEHGRQRLNVLVGIGAGGGGTVFTPVHFSKFGGSEPKMRNTPRVQILCLADLNSSNDSVQKFFL